MIVDGPGDFFRLALRARVETADDSLQFGKFAHHLRDQVALGEFRGAVGTRHVRLRDAAAEPLLGKPARERAHALDFIAIASEARFVGDRCELRQIVAQLDFLIGLPEELRIGKTRAQHALVPGAHQALGILRQIDDRKKMRREFPVRASSAKYF